MSLKRLQTGHPEAKQNTPPLGIKFSYDGAQKGLQLLRDSVEDVEDATDRKCTMGRWTK